MASILLSRLDGLQLLDASSRSSPELPSVLISGHGDSETAVSAIKRGAYDLIETFQSRPPDGGGETCLGKFAAAIAKLRR